MIKRKKIKEKRLKPLSTDEFDYVFFEDIEKFHGSSWFQEWKKAFGEVNTCGSVEVNGKLVGVCFYWDYERFADVVDYYEQTYFD